MKPEQIHAELRQRYATVSQRPAGQFSYPVGRASAVGLQYRHDWLSQMPDVVADTFVGVGNPFSLGEPQPGWKVLDVGCGAGFDAQMASHFVGPEGEVVGVDLSEEMLAVARRGKELAGLTNLDFRQGPAEKLPMDSEWADLVISNGVLNLATCKDTAFREVFRVLKPAGRFQAADLVLVAELPPDVLTDRFAWSN